MLRALPLIDAAALLCQATPLFRYASAPYRYAFTHAMPLMLLLIYATHTLMPPAMLLLRYVVIDDV